jgi:DNA-binding XRE family transcriptional regulator
MANAIETHVVGLFTANSSFESAWRTALEEAGLATSTAAPEAVDARAMPGTALVLDATAYGDDEDELLAHVAFARARGALPAVALASHEDFASVQDLLDELTAGLVARGMGEAPRVATALARRLDPARATRFEYLTVAPLGSDLLGVLADGRVALMQRPLGDSDDGSEIDDIVLGDDAQTAEVWLRSGARIFVSASDCAAHAAGGARSVVEVRADGHGRNGTATGHSPAGAADGLVAAPLEGPRIGQRLRALRLAAGLTQAELARRTGIHRPNIARVEAGRHTPSIETLARIAAAMGVPTSRVLDAGSPDPSGAGVGPVSEAPLRSAPRRRRT